MRDTLGVREKLGLAAVALVAIALTHRLCNFFFRCGCSFTGRAHCNIHHAVGPHCPWCEGSWHFIPVAASWVVGAWLGARLVAGRSGGATAALTGYPHFIVW